MPAMGDMGDDFRAWRDHKREQKARFRAGIPDALAMLDRAQIPYRCLGGGEHYRVAAQFNWWPSTGRWRSMDGRRTGFKVGALIRAVKECNS